jgi:hypothetical protein
VRSGTTDRLIPCCWAECDRPGLEKFAIKIVESPVRTLVHLFCSQRHRLYYAFGPTAYGQLPAGERTTDARIVVPSQRWKDKPA